MKLPLYFKYYDEARASQDHKPSAALHVYQYRRGEHYFYVLHHTSYGVPHGCTDAQPGCP